MLAKNKEAEAIRQPLPTMESLSCKSEGGPANRDFSGSSVA